MSLLDTIYDRQEAIRQEMEELQAKKDFTAKDQAKFDRLMAEAEGLGLKAKNYCRMHGLAMPEEAHSAAAQAWSGGSVSITRQQPVYKNLGEQLLDIRAMTVDGTGAPAARERYTQVVNAASGGSTSVPTEGGYLVETDKASDILTTTIDAGVFSSRCTQQVVGVNSDSFAYLAADDRDRSTGKVNGISVYRKAEADTMTAGGKALLKEREIRLEDMYGLVYVTNRMLRDASAMAEYIKRILREQLAFTLNKEIWEGDGSGQCLGIMNSALPVTVSKETSQTAGTIKAENIVKMMSRFRGDIRKAAWFVNQDCLAQLPLLAIGDNPVYQPDFREQPFGALFSLPVVPAEFCKSVGTKGDIVLADWSQYLLITKGGIEEAESMHVKFLTDEMAYRFIMRCNGQPLHDDPITPLNGSNTVSPFVMLETR